jgi:glycosyltransferase involved in cell wall biosynthesis
VIDEQWPRPDRDAGSQAVLSHMRALRRLGWRVEFAAAQAMAGDAGAAAMLQSDGIVVHAAPAVYSVEEVLRRQPDRYGLIYLHRMATAVAYAGLARQQQRRARLIYSVADLHHLRLARQAQIEARPELLRAARATQAREWAAIRQVDAVLTHSDVEAGMIARAIPGAPVHVVPWSVRPWRSEPAAGRAGVLMVANFAHAPNLDGADWLISEVMPRVWAEAPEIFVNIAGADLPIGLQQKFRAAGERVRLLGTVADLVPLYRAARLAVAPLRFGAGLKGKVLEAWAAGLPCAMTPIAAEGFSLPGELAGTVADDAASLARLIVDLHGDAARAERLGRAGRAVLRARFSLRRERDALAAAGQQGGALPRSPPGAKPLDLNELVPRATALGGVRGQSPLAKRVKR